MRKAFYVTGGVFATMMQAVPASALTAPATSPAGGLCDFWVVSQATGADFANGPGLLGGFGRQLFAVDFADLGKRRRVVAFRAGSACEIAQKLQAGFACVEGVVS